MNTDSHPLFPCYGEHSRMGHKVIVGHFDVFPGSTCAICRVPALDADPETFKLATEEQVEVVPMDGPAFFGFRVLSEARAMEALRANQPTDWDAHHAANEMKRIAMRSVDAEEVRPARSIFDSDDTEDGSYRLSPDECACRGAGLPTGTCPDCGSIPF